MPLLFSMLVLSSSLLLYLGKAITLSPTRHSLIYYYPLAIVSSYGYAGLAKYFCRNRFGSLISKDIFLLGKYSLFLKRVLLAFGVALTFGIYSYSLSNELLSRIDLVTPQIIKIVQQSDILYYDFYYNFSFSIAPELRHMKESSLAWEGSLGKVITKSNLLTNKPFYNIVYATNSFEPKSLDRALQNIKASSDCQSVGGIKTRLVKRSEKVVDAPPHFLSPLGTNSLSLYSVVCYK